MFLFPLSHTHSVLLSEVERDLRCFSHTGTLTHKGAYAAHPPGRGGVKSESNTVDNRTVMTPITSKVSVALYFRD